MILRLSGTDVPSLNGASPFIPVAAVLSASLQVDQFMNESQLLRCAGAVRENIPIGDDEAIPSGHSLVQL